jgi:hypothetical protein
MDEETFEKVMNVVNNAIQIQEDFGKELREANRRMEETIRKLNCPHKPESCIFWVTGINLKEGYYENIDNINACFKDCFKCEAIEICSDLEELGIKYRLKSRQSVLKQIGANKFKVEDAK